MFLDIFPVSYTHLDVYKRQQVDFENGQKTGFFLDQKYTRQAVSRISRGKRVLDCFTHTGSFGLNAAMGGAQSVHCAVSYTHLDVYKRQVGV